MTGTALRIPQLVPTLCMAVVVLCLPWPVAAHPMGNFSVNHYSRLYLRPGATELTYVLDLAEIPAFQLLGAWQIDWKDQSLLEEKARPQAREWLADAVLLQAGRKLRWRLKSVSPTAVEGAGGLPVLRIAIEAEATPGPGEISFEDRNFPGRAGWKEIVVDRDPGIRIASSSRGSEDISKALTFYPTDPGITPPQDLTATVNWSLARPAVHTSGTAIPVSVPARQPVTFSQAQPAGPGSVVRGDFLSGLMQRRNPGSVAMLIGICVAFGLGAMHALSPGHGKTIVAAYLVGSRGTLKHAGLLGLTVTFTHTISVFALGLGMLFFQRFFVAEKVLPLLGAVSGLSIVGVGLMLLYQRAKALAGGDVSHGHEYEFDAPQKPARTRIAELREKGTGRTVAAGDTITADREAAPRGLLALGVSGGIVPCPSALILMLSAIALGHPGLGLILLISFSTGLALVLMACGAVAVYAKRLIPSNSGAVMPTMRLIPVLSALVVIFLGLVMTGVSAGWIQPVRFIS